MEPVQHPPTSTRPGASPFQIGRPRLGADMKVMLSVVAAAMVSTAQAVPSKPVVPSMANGLKGAAMIGHRWISSTANLTLERELEAMGVRDVWTSGETEAVVPPEMWDRVELLMGGRQWCEHPRVPSPEDECVCVTLSGFAPAGRPSTRTCRIFSRRTRMPAGSTRTAAA